MTVLTLAAVVLFIFLGRWQWHRAEEKRALAASFADGAGSVQPLAAHTTLALPRYTRVSVHGHYDSAHQFLLDNAPQDGRTGYEVLTPLQLADGRTLIVNRGWIPMPSSRRELPDLRFDAPADSEVRGRLDALPVAPIALGHVPPAADTTWPKVTGFPTMVDLSTALGQPLEARAVLLDADQQRGFGRNWQPGGGGLTPERHLSYAAQWWTFAALALGLYVFLNRRTAGS